MKNTNKTFYVGLGTCGIAAGADNVYQELKTQQSDQSERIAVIQTSCNGMCYLEPIVELRINNRVLRSYYRVDKEQVPSIINEALNLQINDKQQSGQQETNLKLQTRIVLENCGVINPESIDDYLQHDGYQAITTMFSSMSPEEVIDEISLSGLRGRGGAGFPTGKKWSLARQSDSQPKYVICNADEGDPGAFMDRAIIEGDPHRVIEGLIINAYAIGANHGYVYVRAEYPLAVRRLHHAIDQAEHAGYLGKDILGSGFDFHIHVKEGAGAFVCGEETALIASIEGQRGMPRLKPPYPAESGLWGQPSNINNVETLSTVPWIIRKGASAFSALGTLSSKGTKVFALAGKIKNGGLVEVEMGTSLRTIIEDIGGETSSGLPLKAVQLGGPSGGCIPAHLIDTAVDYEQITTTGAIMGSGGMIVMDESTCMVDVARYFMSFIQKESCGKCTFCRIGTKRMLEIVERITSGHGKQEDIDLLQDLSGKIQIASLCQLGRTAPNPVLTTMKYFKDEYMEHILKQHCRAGVCKALISYRIDEDTCTGCTLCARKCPVKAITGRVREPHRISDELCIRCNQCLDVCKFNAVIKE